MRRVVWSQPVKTFERRTEFAVGEVVSREDPASGHEGS